MTLICEISLFKFYKVNYFVVNFIIGVKKYHFVVELKAHFIIIMYIITSDDFNYFKLGFDCSQC